GMGLPIGPVLIDVLHRNFNATQGGDWMMACHAVRLLASASKDRTSSEHADWVATKVALGEALVEVPDYARCVHTRAGQRLGRGLMPLPDRDFDVTEVAVPWQALTTAGHEVVFASEQAGASLAADPKLLTGVIFGQLGAEPEPKQFYRDLTETPRFRSPIAWT